MATLLLATAGQALGSTLFGGVAGSIAGAALGAAGALVGGMIDRALFPAASPQLSPQTIRGPRLQDLHVTSSTEGAPIARVYGRMRVGGQVIWSTKIKEVERVRTTTTTTRAPGGKRGGGSRTQTQTTTTVTYEYYGTFAVALCEGPISWVAQVWADGKPLALADVNCRVYVGDEAQDADPKIEAVEGAGNAPAYRGLAYLVFEELPLAAYGNRLPNITAEVVRRPPATAPRLEDALRAVTMIPGMGEFAYATTPIAAQELGATTPQNTISGRVDFLAALDQLAEQAPNVRHIELVVSWHGTDLRAGHCQVRPKVETPSKNTTPWAWRAGGIGREAALVVSLEPDGAPYVGGAPADRSIVEAIGAMKARGFTVSLYPFLMMDIPPGSALPSPYGGTQPAFPWRGRITCDPAPGLPGSPDKTATAAAQVAAFFGAVQPADVAWNGETVTCARPDDWGWRRFVLTMARLAVAAGGVESILIGTEFPALTGVRSGPTTFPAVDEFKSLAAAVRSIVGSGCKISYAADWTEYGPRTFDDGSGDVLFHLDPLWSDPNIDFVGIDNYMPIADWRDGTAHADALAGARSVYDLDYLRANIEGGELYDWYYPTPADREAQNRVPIVDTAHGEAWVFRIKDLRGWWENAHHDRPGGARSATPTGWVPRSKPIRFTEIGCAAVDRAANQPNVFVDPKSAESFLPYFSTGRRDLAMQRAFLEASLRYWADPTNNPESPLYAGRMIDPDLFVWTWDARPYPDFPRRGGVWRDQDNYRRGHWINGRLGVAPLGDVVADLCAGLGVSVDVSDLDGVVVGYALDRITSPRDALGPLETVHFFDAVESEGAIRFRHRGAPPALTVTADDLVAGEGEDFTRRRAQETDLPGAAALRFVDEERDYRQAAVGARRLVGSTRRVLESAVNLVIDPADAQGICESMLFERHVSRETITCALPPSLIALDPGDVVAFDLDGRTLEARLDAIGLEGARPVTATRADAAVYAWRAGSAAGRRAAPAPVDAVPLFEILDLPLISDGAAEHSPWFAAYGEPWRAPAVFRSPGESGFVLDAVVPARSPIGNLTAPLYSGPAGRWDRGNAVFVAFPAGVQLESRDALAVLAGANTLALRTPSGEWEVIQFLEAQLLSPGLYRLSGLLRGQLGTEPFMGDPTPAGARAVLLTGALVQSSLPLSSRALPVTWKYGPSNRPENDPSYRTTVLAAQGAGLRPYAPAHLRGERLAGGDVRLTWVRRTRLNGDPWEQEEVPLGEASERYVVEIHAGGALMRTLETTAPEVLWTAAMQAADVGGPASLFEARVFQVSTIYGRGPAARRIIDV